MFRGPKKAQPICRKRTSLGPTIVEPPQQNGNGLIRGPTVDGLIGQHANLDVLKMNPAKQEIQSVGAARETILPGATFGDTLGLGGGILLGLEKSLFQRHLRYGW